MTTTTHRTTGTDLRVPLALILAGALWDLVMTTVFFSLVALPDGLWFLVDGVGMALIAVGFARYSRKTLPVAAAFGLFALLHLALLSTNPDGFDFLLGPTDLLIALAGIVSTIWIARTDGWGAAPAGVLGFTASIIVIGLLLAVFGDAGLPWGLPLYSVLMLLSWLALRRGAELGTSAA